MSAAIGYRDGGTILDGMEDNLFIVGSRKEGGVFEVMFGDRIIF